MSTRSTGPMSSALSSSSADAGPADRPRRRVPEVRPASVTRPALAVELGQQKHDAAAAARLLRARRLASDHLRAERGLSRYDADGKP